MGYVNVSRYAGERPAGKLECNLRVGCQGRNYIELQRERHMQIAIACLDRIGESLGFAKEE
jgi:hypothetical protein